MCHSEMLMPGTFFSFEVLENFREAKVMSVRVFPVL